MADISEDASAQAIVRAARFELVDRDGTCRATFGFHDDGTPALDIMDREGRIRASVGVMFNGAPIIGVYDEAGQVSVGLTVLTDGTSALHLCGRDGSGAGLNIDPAGQSGLILSAPGGDTLVGLTANSNGAWGLGLFDRNPQLRVGATVDVTGTTTLAMLDETGSVVWTAP